MVVPEDWEKFHENDHDSDIARASDAIYFPRSEAGARLWTEQQAARVPDGDNMRLAIETLDGELVGTINSHHCDPRNGNFQYGVAIFRDYHRRGYASEAATIA
ncbi:GNAT family N-acetyltransferase [Brevibacillus fortis]|uniref:GNAT family N-acetyltransferase n=1 Tax=Brevibacillus fortis TaxID=2126352 RepID=UPI0038FC95E6